MLVANFIPYLLNSNIYEASIWTRTLSFPWFSFVVPSMADKCFYVSLKVNLVHKYVRKFLRNPEEEGWHLHAGGAKPSMV